MTTLYNALPKRAAAVPFVLPGTDDMPLAERLLLADGYSAAKCPACWGLGWVNNGDACPMRDCAAGAAKRAEQTARLRTVAKLPARYASAHLDDFHALPADLQQGKRLAHAIVSAWASAPAFRADPVPVFRALGLDPQVLDDPTPKCWLVLAGDVGMGKTYLAAAALNWILTERAVPVVWLRLDDFKARLLAAADMDEREREATRYHNAPVLILDEFGLADPDQGHTNTAHTLQRIESLVRYRHGRNLPTMFTTNRTQATLIAEFGMPIASVVVDNALWTPVGGTAIRSHAGPLPVF